MDVKKPLRDDGRVATRGFTVQSKRRAAPVTRRARGFARVWLTPPQHERRIVLGGRKAAKQRGQRRRRRRHRRTRAPEETKASRARRQTASTPQAVCGRATLPSVAASTAATASATAAHAIANRCRESGRDSRGIVGKAARACSAWTLGCVGPCRSLELGRHHAHGVNVAVV